MDPYLLYRPDLRAGPSSPLSGERGLVRRSRPEALRFDPPGPGPLIEPLSPPDPPRARGGWLAWLRGERLRRAPA